MTHIEGFHHITLPCSNLADAERFHVELLGLTLERRFDRETFLRHAPDRADEADADNSPLHLTLRVGRMELDVFLQRDHKMPATLRAHPHFAFDVDHDQLDAFIVRLERAGVPIEGPRRLGPPGHASIYFVDPFGNLLELATTGYQGKVPIGPPDLVALAERMHATA